MNTFTSAVNQKLVFAELLVAQARQANGHRHLQQALLQGAALQLELAFRFYLKEIAAAYQCRTAAEVGDLWTLIANLQLLGKDPAETRELYNLSGGNGTWLAELQACCRAIALPPEVARSREVDSNLISAVSIAQRHDWSSLVPELLDGWLLEFQSLVERHRQAMVEC